MKIKELSRILPFLGVSIISIYWLVIFDKVGYVRESLSCFNSNGYSAVQELFSKKELLSVISNCSRLSFDLSSVSALDGPFVSFKNSGSDPKFRKLEDLKNDFDTTITKFDEVTSEVSFIFNAPKFRAFLSRVVAFQRNGLTFTAKQMITMDTVYIDFRFFVRIVVPVISTSLILTNYHRSFLSLVFSLGTVAMHAFLNGRFLQWFRLIAALSWAAEFCLMLDLNAKGYIVVVPILLMTFAVSLIFYALLMGSSKWFHDMQTSFMVTVSLMVGDHIMELMTSLQGQPYKTVILFFCSTFLIFILVFIIMSSIGKPFNRLIHMPGDSKSTAGF